MWFQASPNYTVQLSQEHSALSQSDRGQMAWEMGQLFVECCLLSVLWLLQLKLSSAAYLCKTQEGLPSLKSGRQCMTQETPLLVWPLVTALPEKQTPLKLMQVAPLKAIPLKGHQKKKRERIRRRNCLHSGVQGYSRYIAKNRTWYATDCGKVDAEGVVKG